VNNAAITRHVPIVDTTMELYSDVVGVNLTGAFMACKFAVPALLTRGGGSIVNIGSVAGVRDSGSTHPAYSASKAALLGLTVDLAGAYGRDNVRVNTVLPGMISSPMQESVGRIDDDIRSRLNVLGRMGSAWDIAHAVLFLCSDEATYITGLALPVDGGATASMPGTALRGGVAKRDG
jgi:NAD(P)-dependent dehydrogenase (short-subunit alcohol dehydrogenase family)